MKPFNDSVQPGDRLIYGPTGEEYYFVGTTKAGNVVAERETCSYALTLDQKNVFLPPKKTTYYLNIFRDSDNELFSGYAYYTEEAANIAKNTCRAFVKTISFEVEE